MKCQAIIHYKNDEEDQGPIREDFFEALVDLTELVNQAVMSEDGFSADDVQFAQVSNLEE